MFRSSLVFASLALTASLVLTASQASAQAPVITPAGDPSVDADTIYRLALDPADHPEETAAWLLDDGVARYEADGRSVRTFRQVVQILRPEAVEDWQELSFSYSPGHERLTINWIRVVQPDGRVVSPEPTHVQDSDVPAQYGDPVYSDRKVRRVSLSGVAPGTIVDYSYTTEELKPFLPGDFSQYWAVSTGLYVARSRFIVDLPAGLPVRIRERNLNFERRTVTRGGRTVHQWATRDIPRVKGEAYAADSTQTVTMSVALSSPISWDSIGAWYAGNARDRYTLSAEVARAADSVVQGAATRADTLRALHKWVAQDIRYVSIALGLGGYQPRTPAEVLRTGYGDCKDKATLFIGALRRYGMEAYPVLLNSTGGVDRSMPSLDQLDHAIAAIRQPGGWQFVDLTASLTPFGELPFAEQGEFGLVVLPDGSEEVTLPKAPIAVNRSEIRIVGELTEDGLFNGWYQESGVGSHQYSLRSAFENPFDSTTTANFARALAQKFFPDAEGDSVIAFAGKDLAAEPVVRVRVRNGRATTEAGGAQLLTLPFGSVEGFDDAADRLLLEPRRFPIDAAEIFGEQTTVAEYRLELPAGWRARLPKSVTAKSPFGEYSTEYSQNGRELRITRRFVGAAGIFAPERITDLAGWFRAMSKDDARFILLEPGPAGAD